MKTFATNLIKKCAIAIVVFSVASLLSPVATSDQRDHNQPQQVSPQDRNLDVTLENWTGASVTAIYLSPNGSAGWEENIVAGTSLDDGDMLHIRFDPRETSTLWDMRVEGLDGHYAEWRALDLSTTSWITLRLNLTSEPVAVAELE